MKECANQAWQLLLERWKECWSRYNTGRYMDKISDLVGEWGGILVRLPLTLFSFFQDTAVSTSTWIRCREQKIRAVDTDSHRESCPQRGRLWAHWVGLWKMGTDEEVLHFTLKCNEETSLHSQWSSTSFAFVEFAECGTLTVENLVGVCWRAYPIGKCCRRWFQRFSRTRLNKTSETFWRPCHIDHTYLIPQTIRVFL